MTTEEKIYTWLGSVPAQGAVPDEVTDVLSRFLQGYRLEIPADDEPFVALYDCAVASADGLAQMSRAVRALLCRWLEARWSPTLPGRGQYNLLRLSAELSKREQLAEPLWALYRRRLVAGHYESYRSMPLTEALQMALLRNPDPSGESFELWSRALHGESDDYLKPSVLDGFLGLLHYPELPGDEVSVLASAVREVFFRSGESAFLSALRTLGNVRPDICMDVLSQAGLDIAEVYVRIVSDRLRAAIEQTHMADANAKAVNLDIGAVLAKATGSFRAKVTSENRAKANQKAELLTRAEIERLSFTVVRQAIDREITPHRRALTKVYYDHCQFPRPQALKFVA